MRYQNDVVKVVHFFFVKSVESNQSNRYLILNRSSQLYDRSNNEIDLVRSLSPD